MAFKEDAIFHAKLAEQSERYMDMFAYIKVAATVPSHLS